MAVNPIAAVRRFSTVSARKGYIIQTIVQKIQRGWPLNEATDPTGPTMADDPLSKSRLLSAARRTLLPQPFPARRDVEVAGFVPLSPAGGTYFYDHLWPRPGRLALAAVKLAGDGLDSALRAASLRHLLRAAMTTAEPSDALRFCRDTVPEDGTDIALAVLDTFTGELRSAAFGAAASLASGGDVGSVARLTPGSRLWLAAGAEAIGQRPEGADVGKTVRAVGETIGSAALVLLSFADSKRPVGQEALSVSNDLGDIPRVVLAFEEFCSRHGLEDAITQGANIALDEILTNVVKYAFTDGEPHEIYVELRAQKDKLIIQVKDDGTPFDPMQVSAPELSDDIVDRQVGGLGIYLTRRIMDGVRYRRVRGWNVTTLEKAIAAEGTS